VAQAPQHPKNLKEGIPGFALLLNRELFVLAKHAVLSGANFDSARTALHAVIAAMQCLRLCCPAHAHLVVNFLPKLEQYLCHFSLTDWSDRMETQGERMSREARKPICHH